MDIPTPKHQVSGMASKANIYINVMVFLTLATADLFVDSSGGWQTGQLPVYTPTPFPTYTPLPQWMQFWASIPLQVRGALS